MKEEKTAQKPSEEFLFPCEEDDRTECWAAWICYTNGVYHSCKTSPLNCIYITKAGAVMPPYPRYPGEIVARALAQEAKKAAESAVLDKADKDTYPQAKEEETEA